MKKKYFTVFLFIILLCVLSGACTNPYLREDEPVPTLNIPSTPTPPEKNTENAAGTIVLGVSKLDTLNPLTTGNQAVRQYMMLVYDSLVVPGTDLTPSPHIAESWSTADGGITWKFKIKENIKYHDDSVCTVYDVKNTIEWIARNGGTYADCVKGISRFNILSQFEIEIVMQTPDAFVPCKMIFPIIKSEDLDHYTEPNGTGMYRYGGQNALGNYTFTINQNYYGSFPKLASFEIKNFESPAALYEGDADVMLCYDDNVIQYARRNGYNVCEYTDGVLSCLLPSKNTSLQVRKYVSSILDRRTIVNAVIAGHGVPKLLPFSEGTYYRKTTDSFAAPSTEAPPATINLIVRETDTEMMRLSAVVKSQLEAKGSVVTVTAYKDAEFLNTVKDGVYDFALVNMNIGLWPDFYDLFATAGSINYNGYSNPSMDSLLNSLRTAYADASISGVTDTASFGAYALAQTDKIGLILADTLPLIGVYTKNASVLLSDKIKGVNLHNFTFWNAMESFDSWYIEMNKG